MRRPGAARLDGRGKVLVVDDEAMFLEVTTLILQSAGFTVSTATSAVALPLRVRSESPDVIVLDVGLPGLKGHRAVQPIREGAPAGRVAIILYSGEDEGELRHLASCSGADGAVAKASGPKALIDEIERVLGVAGGPPGPAAARED